MVFRSFSVAFLGLAMTLTMAMAMATIMASLPITMSFSTSPMALCRLPKTIRKPVVAVENDASLGSRTEGPPSGFDVASFFEFAGVNLDPKTFLVENINNDDDFIAKNNNSSVSVYSAEGSVAGGQRGANTLPVVRIYWTILQASTGDEIDNESGDLKHILQAFEGIVTRCWVIDHTENDDSDRVRRLLVRTPEELMAALGALETKKTDLPETIATTLVALPQLIPFVEELIVTGNRGEARINPDAIDGSTVLQPQIFLDRDGFVFEVFSANRKHAAAVERIAITAEAEKEAVPMTTAVTNQTIWWRTLNTDCDNDPYGDLSEVWTDEEFRTLIPSLGGGEDIFFLRRLAIGLKFLAIVTRHRTSTIGWVFRRHDRELPAQKTQQVVPNHISLVVQRLLSMTGMSFFLGIGLSQSLWRKIPQNVLYGITSGLIQNRPYRRSIVIWLSCVLAFEAVFKPALQQTWPLERKSQFVEHITTISIAMQSVGIFLHAVQDCIVILVKFPVVASLKLLSVVFVWWQRQRGITRHAVFDGVIEQLLSRKGDCPFWMDAVIFAPVREELVFRFAFDKIWHGFLRAFGMNSVVAWNFSSPSFQPSWIWANSLLFGLVHACNWLPVQLHSSFASGLGDYNDDDRDVWKNVFGALFQSSGTFVTAFFVFNPMYVHHGLSASIGAHAALNAIFVGLPLLISRIRDRWISVPKRMG